MFDVRSRLGVQSWCFRHFKSIEGLIAQVKGIGLARVELCRAHVNFEDEAGFEGTIEQFQAAGIEITSIGVQLFTGDEAREEKWFKFCKLAGATMISTDIDVASLPAGLQSAQKLAEKYEVRLGIHNHGGYHWLGNGQMLRNIFKHTGPAVGLCLDTAWCLQTGDDPVKWAEEFGERLYGVHVKDFVFNRAGKWTDVVVGAGNLRLGELLALARAAPGMRTVTLEYEGDVENPGPKLRECAERVGAASMQAETT